MINSKSILIADDHPLILKGLHDFLVEHKHNVIASAKHGKEALALIKAHKPEVAILDINMPHLNGIEIAHQIKELGLMTKVVLITFEKSPTIYEKSKQADVYGYLLKEFALEEINKCLEAVFEGESYFSQVLMDEIEFSESIESINKLTSSEQTILKHLAENKIGKEIAENLSISIRTVEKHKSTIRQKLDLDSKPATLNLFAYTHKRFL